MGEDEDKPKVRDKNLGIADDRDVRQLLFAAAADLPKWQNEAVHLEAILASPKSGDSPEVQAKLFTLRSSVNSTVRTVDGLVDRLPERLRSHGRVIDVVGALRGLQQRLAELG